MASIMKREGKKGTTYKVTIRLKGYPTQTESFKKLTDAKRWAADTESAISQGKHFKTIEAKKHTIADLIDYYIMVETPKKPKSGHDQLVQFKWWKEEIGMRTLAEVTPALLRQCKDKLGQETTRRGKLRSGATVNRYLAALSGCFTIAVNEKEWIEVNPMSKIKRNKEPEGRTRFLSDDERDRLLDACMNSQNKQLYLIVKLAISTGARHGEIMWLTWDDVSFDQRRLILRDTKNGETRAVPLVGETFGLLKEYSKIRRIDTNLVFPGTTNSKQPILIREAWDHALLVAKIENFRFHDLRHTCASYLAMNGATLAEIAEVLGHKTLQMVKRYAHLTELHVSGVVERMNKKIELRSVASGA